MEAVDCRNIAIDTNIQLPIVETIFTESIEGSVKTRRILRIVFDGHESRSIIVDPYFTPVLSQIERLRVWLKSLSDDTRENKIYVCWRIVVKTS